MTQDTEDPDMVERVADALWEWIQCTPLDACPNDAESLAKLALEASHHAELVAENKALRDDLATMRVALGTIRDGWAESVKEAMAIADNALSLANTGGDA